MSQRRPRHDFRRPAGGGIVATVEGGRLNAVASSDAQNQAISELQGCNATSPHELSGVSDEARLALFPD